MAVLSRTLAQAMRARDYVSENFTLGTADTEDAILTQIRWKATMKKIYLIVTTDVGGATPTGIWIGYAANGGSRGTADTDYYVESVAVPTYSMRKGSVCELTLAHTVINPGEIITLHIDRGSATGYIKVHLCWEYSDPESMKDPVSGSTTTTTTSTSTSTSTST